MSSVEERIAELEMRIAFQDDTLQALNDVLVSQQAVIDRLAAQLSVLRQRQEELSGRLEAGDEPPPPHY